MIVEEKANVLCLQGFKAVDMFPFPPVSPMSILKFFNLRIPPPSVDVTQ